MLKPGDIVAGRFRLETELGRGGMGVVYRATRLSDEEAVALKMLLREAPTARERARFEQEIALAAQLAHPNCVKVFEGGYTEDGAPFLVCELLEGRDLADAIGKRGRFSVERVARVGMQVLSALERAHALGIVHRDVKPANIFLCPLPQPDFVKVLDFGVAKLVDADLQTALTSVGGTVGSPQYIAPEQLVGEAVGPATDLYALGLVLAEMLHGRPVVQGDTAYTIFMAQASPLPIELPPSVIGSPLGPVISRATQKDVRARFSEAREMADAIRASGVSLEGSPPLEGSGGAMAPGQGWRAAHAAPEGQAPTGGFRASRVWAAALVSFCLGASAATVTARGTPAREREGATGSGSPGVRTKKVKSRSGEPSEGPVRGRLSEVSASKIERAVREAGLTPRLTSEHGNIKVWMAYRADDPIGSVTWGSALDEISAMILVDTCPDDATTVRDAGNALCVQLDDERGEERALIDAISD